MKADKVPQDKIATQAEARKAIYAIDAGGLYGIVPSSGWEVEETATRQAIAEFERLTAIAYSEVVAGAKSPLYFHMYRRRMDIALLAQAVGLPRWRLKRHLRPQTFARLSPAWMSRYAETLGLTVDELQRLPKSEPSP